MTVKFWGEEYDFLHVSWMNFLMKTLPHKEGLGRNTLIVKCRHAEMENPRMTMESGQ